MLHVVSIDRFSVMYRVKVDPDLIWHRTDEHFIVPYITDLTDTPTRPLIKAISNSRKLAGISDSKTWRELYDERPCSFPYTLSMQAFEWSLFCYVTPDS